MNIIKNCKECELNSESCNCVCLDLAAAPSPSVPAVESWPTPTQPLRLSSAEIRLILAIRLVIRRMLEQSK